MELRLYSIESCPRHLPIWEAILDDLGNPPAPRIAKALGVGKSTVYHWKKTGSAPRIACLALYWLTRWGRSEVDARATNDATAAVGLARSLLQERDELRAALIDAEAAQQQLERLFMKRELAGAHGSDATVGHSRTDTSPAAPPPALAWPALAPPPAGLRPGGRPALPEVAVIADRPSSPAAPRQSGRSSTVQAPARSAEPQPAVPREDAELMPLASECNQDDANVPHSNLPAAHRVKVVGTETSPGATRLGRPPALIRRYVSGKLVSSRPSLPPGAAAARKRAIGGARRPGSLPTTIACLDGALTTASGSPTKAPASEAPGPPPAHSQTDQAPAASPALLGLPPQPPLDRRHRADLTGLSDAARLERRRQQNREAVRRLRARRALTRQTTKE